MSDDLVKEARELPDPQRNLLSHNERVLIEFANRMADRIQELEAQVERLNGALDAGLRYAAGVTKIFAERFPGEELEGTDVQRYYDEFLPAARRARQSLGDSNG